MNRVAKLTPEQVRQIREVYATGRWTQREIAAHFNVTTIQIGRIVRGEVWQSVGPREDGDE